MPGANLLESTKSHLMSGVTLQVLRRSIALAHLASTAFCASASIRHTETSLLILASLVPEQLDRRCTNNAVSSRFRTILSVTSVLP